MTKVILVGVAHEHPKPDLTGLLITPETEERFYQAINPLLTGNTALLLEGFYEDLVSGSERYAYMLNTSGIRPELLVHTPTASGADVRWTASLRADQSIPKHMSLITEATMFLRPVGTLPATLTELMVRAQAGLEYRLPGTRREIIHSISVYRRREQAVNKGYTLEIRKRMSKFDCIILVSGAAHSLRLHLEQGWPFVSLVSETPRMLERFFYSQLLMYGKRIE